VSIPIDPSISAPVRGRFAPSPTEVTIEAYAAKDATNASTPGK